MGHFLTILLLENQGYGKNAKIIYHTPAIISFSLYILSPLFEGQKHFLGAFFLKLWPYVQLVFKSGL